VEKLSLLSVIEQLLLVSHECSSHAAIIHTASDVYEASRETQRCVHHSCQHAHLHIHQHTAAALELRYTAAAAAATADNTDTQLH
jgi:hypothetical protein